MELDPGIPERLRASVAIADQAFVLFGYRPIREAGR